MKKYFAILPCFFVLFFLLQTSVGAVSSGALRVEVEDPYYAQGEEVVVRFYADGVIDLYGIQIDYLLQPGETADVPPFVTEAGLFDIASSTQYKNSVTSGIATVILLRNKAGAATLAEETLLLTLTFTTAQAIASSDLHFDLTDVYSDLTYQLANLCIKLADSGGQPIPYLVSLTHRLPTFDLLETEETIEAGSTYLEEDVVFDPSLTLLVEGSVDTAVPGSYPITFRVKTDKNVESLPKIKTVHVIDTTPPSFEIDDQSILAEQFTVVDWTLFVLSTFDNASGTLSISIVSDEVDYDKPGTYFVTLRVTDGANLFTEKTITVTVTPIWLSVRFLDEDGVTVLKTQTVAKYGSATAPDNPTKAATAQYTYTFSGWDVAYDNITGALDVKATYSSIVNQYAVRFLDEDGLTVLKTMQVAYGSAAVAPANPTKAATAQYTYTFSGWDVAFTNITGALDVKATYSSIVNQYTVRFLDEDGLTVLKTTQVPYGSAAIAPANPSKAATAQYTYTFSGWDVAFTNITGALDVKTTYSSIVNQYTVRFLDDDGVTVLKTMQVAYGSAAIAPTNPTKAATAQYTYTFSGWNVAFDNITGALDVKATYSSIVNQYTVHFLDEDGLTVLKTMQVAYGSAAIAPTNPTKAATAQFTYTFSGWDVAFTNITGALDVKATYSSIVNQYTVRFLDEDGLTVLKTMQVAYGSAAIAPANPTKSSTVEYRYMFDGWDVAFDIITGLLDVKATYVQSANQYTVRFLDEDGITVLNTQIVVYGASATAPTDPIKAATAQYTYTFSGWDVAFTNINGALDVKATYSSTVNQYTVRFLDDDGVTVLKTMVVAYGSAAIAPDNPTKVTTAQFTYSFSGWDVAFTNITGALDVKATYSSIVNQYTVRFLDEDGLTVLKTMQVPYGESAIAPDNPTKAGTPDYTFNFGGWDVPFDRVTTNLDVKATYIQAIRQYTVRFLDEDGVTVLKTDEVNKGANAIPPDDPVKPNTAEYSYQFDGWSESYENITANIDLVARYTSTWNQYTVTFYLDDGTTSILSSTIPYGSAAIAPELPTKAEDAYFVYDFSGWSVPFDLIVSHLSVVAQFSRTAKSPSATLAPGIDTVVQNAVWTDSGLVLDDSLYLITVIGTVNAAQIGRYTLEYQITIESLLAQTLYRVVHVIEAAPVVEITLNPGIDTIVAGEVFSDASAVASTGTISVISDLDTTQPGTYRIQYKVVIGTREYIKSRIVTVLPAPSDTPTPTGYLPKERKEEWL
jgi:hypothetical protein